MNYVLIIALIGIPALFLIFRSPKHALVETLAISLALCFLNIDKFSRFKGAGFEAELRTATDKAYAAIEQLKELGLSLSSPIIDNLAGSGAMFQYIPLKYKLERTAKIAETLKKLGASQEEVDDICSTMYERVTWDHIRRILNSLKNANRGKEALIEGISDDAATWNKGKFETFIKEHNLSKGGDTDEWLMDLDYFLKHKKLRREDKWQG